MNLKQLQNIISQGEGDTVEFKSSFNKAVIETIVAFSNTNGGIIVLGCNNDKTIKGVTINDESIQNWINEIKQSTEPSLFPDFVTYNFNNHTLVAIVVDEFPLKPVSYKDRCFVRRKNSNHKLSIQEIAETRLINLNYSFDAFEVDKTFDNLNFNACNYFEKRINLAGRFKSTNKLLDDLTKLSIIKENGKLTKAALLLLGNHHTNIHIGRFKSETTIIDDLMIRSPLILAVEEAIDFIKKNIRLGFEIGGDDLKRKEKWQYPIPVLRELLLNAIVHRDYTNPTDLIVKVFDESVEITNPGKLMGGLTVENLLSNNYISKHRNKLLTEAFYLTGDIEKYGTGFKRIKDWLIDYPNISFDIQNLNDFIKVTINSSNKVPDKVPDWVPDKVPDELTENQLKLLELVKNNNQITLVQMAEKVGISKRKILDNINKLKHKKLIERVGNPKKGYWKILKH